VPPQGAARACAGGQRLIVGRTGGRVFAALDSCPHLELPFTAFGPVELAGDQLVCPWHGWRFDTRTGRCEYAPVYRDDEMLFFQIEGRNDPRGEGAGSLRCFPARLRGGMIEVLLPADLRSL
jgi:nitrite reductase/ring-hydroxylating ferredoxin subunit